MTKSMRNFALRLLGTRTTSLVRLFAMVLVLTINSAAFALPANFSEQTVLTGLTAPVNIVTMPSDGRMLVVEQTGRVRMFDPAVGQSSLTTILTLTDIDTFAERGLASLALDPGFSNNGYFYVYYTQLGNGNRNKIERYTLSGNSAGSPLLVWEDNEAATSCCHFGGGLDFGPDGRLYLTTGEEFDGAQAQNLSRAGGKIIRLNTVSLNSGGAWVRGGNNSHIIPSDNPFVGTSGALGEIWALGLRNPFRAHWDIPANHFYIGEVGGNDQSTAREDLHIGRSGANYGWPNCEGQCANGAYDDPIYDYGHTGATPNGGAIAAGVVYRGSQFPSSYTGKFFFSDYVLGGIYHLAYNGGANVSAVTTFATGAGSPVALEVGPDGSLYVVDYIGERVIRYVYNSGNQAPVITSAIAAPVSGTAPLQVNFAATANDAENNALTYTWFFEDGSQGTGQNQSHVYTQNGTYNAYLQVTDGTNTSQSGLLPVQVGNIPIAVINSPQNASTFRAGDTINFSGAVANPSSGLTYVYEWDIDFLHNAHTHPTLTSSNASGSFPIVRTGHDYHDQTGYSLELTVTDSNGLRSTDRVEIYPEKVNLNLSANPSGLNVFVDGIAIATPKVYDTLIAFEHLVSAAESVCSNGTQYNFSSWSDGGARAHVVTVPATDSNLTANYVSAGSCSDIPTSGLALRLESNNGVQTNGLTVTSWNDLSGAGNHLSVAEGDPTLVPNVLNGYPAVDFDGTGDLLKRTGSISSISAGAANRTMFVVANYRGTGYGGVAVGSAGNLNQTFGLIVAPSGRLGVQAWGGSDLISNTQGTGEGWLVQSAIVNSNNLTHYLNGTAIGSQNHAYNTVLDSIVMGAEIDEVPTVNMQVAAVFMYNRALSASERAQVEAYLQSKYLGSSGGGGGNNGLPTVASPVAGQTLNGTTQTMTWAGNGANVSAYWVYAGSTPQGNQYFDSGSLTPSATSVEVTGMPTDGRTVHLTLWYLDDTGWKTVEQTNPSGSGGGGGGGGTLPAVATPAAGTTLTGNTVSLNWVSNSANVTDYWIYAGSTFQGYNYVNSGNLAATTNTYQLTGLPTDGSQVHLTLWYKIDGAWLSTEQINTAFNQNNGDGDGDGDGGGGGGGGGGGAIPGNGLSAHYDAAQGVNQSGGVITSWLDQSGSNNTLTASGDPQLVANAVNGRPAVDFDGAGDALRRVGSLVGLPAGAGNRSVFLVANYRGTGYGGASFGNAANNSTFGLVVSPSGELMVQGWGVNNDFGSGDSGTGQGWLIQSAVVSGNQLTHYRNNVQIDARTHTFNTASNLFVLGAEIDNVPNVDMQIAELIVYNRALSAADRTQVQNYLASKYGVSGGGGGGSSNSPPQANNDSQSVVRSSSVTFSVTDNDTDPDGNGTIVLNSVNITQQGDHGGAVSNGDGTVTYTHGGDGANADTFTYTVADELGAVSNNALVNMSITGGGSGTPDVNSPAANTTLAGASQLLSWEGNGANVTDYWIYAGSTPLGFDYYNSGNLSGATNSITMTGLPTNGSLVYVTLWYRVDGSWLQTEQVNPAANGVGVPSVSSPIAGSTLSGNSVPFTWASNGTTVLEWWVYLGTTSGGSQLYDSGSLGTALSGTVPMPADGSTVHLTLWFRTAAGWQFARSTYVSN